MIVEQRGIYLFPVSYSDLGEKKTRPAVVISNNKLNNSSKDCIIVPLTSNIKKDPYSIIISDEDLDSGRLIAKSRIRVDKIFNILQELAIYQVGKLNSATFNKIRKDILNLI